MYIVKSYPHHMLVSAIWMIWVSAFLAVELIYVIILVFMFYVVFVCDSSVGHSARTEYQF